MGLKRTHIFFGETIGTFILVFFGCGFVAASILFSPLGLFRIAVVWGFAVTLAIYAARHLSNAHINPAVSLAIVMAKRMPGKKLFVYWSGQFLGAFLAAAALYLIFSHSIAQYEALHGIVRGTPQSVKTAKVFTDFYLSNNPGGENISITTLGAFIAEAAGTFLLAFMVLLLTEKCNTRRLSESLVPVFIGATVTTIICIIGPLTQAGINPARDLSPRIFAYLAGWGEAVFPDKHFGFLTVYVLGPFAGAGAAGLVFTKFVRPMMFIKRREG